MDSMFKMYMDMSSTFAAMEVQRIQARNLSAATIFDTLMRGHQDAGVAERMLVYTFATKVAGGDMKMEDAADQVLKILAAV